jgi:hypothetical protein
MLKNTDTATRKLTNLKPKKNEASQERNDKKRWNGAYEREVRIKKCSIKAIRVKY